MLSQAIRRDDLNTTPPMKRILPILALLFFGVDAFAAPDRPVFCVILVDSLWADHLGCYERNTLPTVDAFAARHAAATVAGR